MKNDQKQRAEKESLFEKMNMRDFTVSSEVSLGSLVVVAELCGDCPVSNPQPPWQDM